MFYPWKILDRRTTCATCGRIVYKGESVCAVYTTSFTLAMGGVTIYKITGYECENCYHKEPESTPTNLTDNQGEQQNA